MGLAPSNGRIGVCESNRTSSSGDSGSGRRAFPTCAMNAKSFKVPSSGKVTLKMRLSPKKLALLRKKGKIKSKLTVTLKDGAGHSSVASKTVTFKR